MATQRTFQLTEEQLQDYMSCPIYFNIKNKSKLKVEPQPTMSKLLNKLVSGFCIQLMDGEVQRLDIIKRKWDMLCRRYPDYINNERARNGFSLLCSFYRWAAENEIIIADVGSPYMLRVQENGFNIEYRGSLGIIALNKNNDPENLLIDFSSRLPDQSLIDLKFKTSLDHIGFRQLYKKNLVGTRVHNVKHNRDFFTIRDVNIEKKKAAEIIKNVAIGIKNNYWYPHETPLCSSCVVRDFCLMYGKS